MTDEAGRWLSPDEQLTNLQASVEYLHALPWHPHKAEAIRDAELQLAELVAQHEQGELAPLWVDEKTPF